MKTVEVIVHTGLPIDSHSTRAQNHYSKLLADASKLDDLLSREVHLFKVCNRATIRSIVSGEISQDSMTDYVETVSQLSGTHPREILETLLRPYEQNVNGETQGHFEALVSRLCGLTSISRSNFWRYMRKGDGQTNED